MTVFSRQPTMCQTAALKSNMEVKQFVLKLSRVLCLVLPELVTYLGAYYAVNIAYRSIDPEFNGKEGILTRLVAYFNSNGQNLARDLTFLLGFYVATVAKRWWAKSVLPVPDNLALFLSAVVLQGPAQDHQLNLNLKRTVIRYENWAFVVLIFDAWRIKMRNVNKLKFRKYPGHPKVGNDYNFSDRL